MSGETLIMQNSVLIKEIFTSVQGEGPYVGYNQLFIRFSKCNLHCKYCDTDFRSDLKEYSAIELAQIVNSAENIHSVSLTGGEPLCDTEFLQEFLPLVHKKIYLETNGTQSDNLRKVIQHIDIVAMDIKLDSCSNMGNLFDKHKDFILVATNECREIFLKIIFDENITDDEINKTIELAQENNLLIVLQPKMNGDVLEIPAEEICEIFNKFNSRYDNVRLIPQVHKFINVQ